MTLSPAVSRLYLKAMGIESWELRDAVPQVGATTAAQNNPAQSVLTSSYVPAYQSSVEAYLDNLAAATVTAVNVVNARVLLLLEAPELAAAGQELLNSMLKAINVEFAGQGVAYLGASEGSVNVRAMVDKVQPSIIIVMSHYHHQIDELATHRAGLHTVTWASIPVAITLHPGALIEIPALKRPAWEDLKRVKALLDG